MIRGDVYWFKFRAPNKRRPVVVLTRQSAIPFLNSVIVAAVTSTVRHLPSEVIIGPEDGMPVVCGVNLHHIHYASKSQLERWVTRLGPERMGQIRDAILYTLQLEKPD